jgi:hypothetical protein
MDTLPTKQHYRELLKRVHPQYSTPTTSLKTQRSIIECMQAMYTLATLPGFLLP